MRWTVRRWIAAAGAGIAALAAGGGGVAASVAGAAGTPASAAVVQAAGGCTTSDCGANHNQVLA